MTEVIYEIVEHDGGWAYKANGVFSESFPTHAEALAAAQRVAAEQRVPGTTSVIEWEDEQGRWHTETASGSDRPDHRGQGQGLTGRLTSPVSCRELAEELAPQQHIGDERGGGERRAGICRPAGANPETAEQKRRQNAD